MRLMAAQAGTPAVKPPQAEGDNFKQMLSNSIGQVNGLQEQSNNMKTAFEQGQPGIDLAQVMVASQKADLAFSAMVEVRNKLVDAYKDIMNMPL